MNEKVTVLHIERDPEAVRLSARLLDEPGPPPREFRVERADGLESGLRALRRDGIGAVLIGLVREGELGPEALKTVRAAAPDVPVVALVEPGEDELGLEAVTLGAQDYQVKDRLSASTLKRALSCAVERQRLLAPLAGELERCRRADQLKDDLLGAVSHQMRTPLTVITAAVASLEEGLAGPLNPKQAELARMAQSNSGRLLRIIDGLLDLSRLESGRARVLRRRVDAARVIRETLEGLRLLRGKTGVTIVEEVAQGLPPVDADPELLAQTLTNLVSNALRFARGRITVLARPEDDRTDGAENVHFSVIDDGPGIPAERLPELFNKFVQLRRERGGDGYKGTGLGLALCAEMVRRLDGRIWAESAPGEGARFHFLLPQHRKAPAGGRRADARTASGAR